MGRVVALRFAPTARGGGWVVSVRRAIYWYRWDQECVLGEIVVVVELENAEDRSDARRGRIDDGSVRRETIEAVADTWAS